MWISEKFLPFFYSTIKSIFNLFWTWPEGMCEIEDLVFDAAYAVCII